MSTLPLGTQAISIIDKREIAFDAHILLRVIRGSAAKLANIGLPATEPAGLSFDPERGTVVLSYAGEPREVSVAANHLGALLVSYCIRAGIPVVRHAEKTVHVRSGAVVVAWTINYFNDPPETAGIVRH